MGIVNKKNVTELSGGELIDMFYKAARQDRIEGIMSAKEPRAFFFGAMKALETIGKISEIQMAYVIPNKLGKLDDIKYLRNEIKEEQIEIDKLKAEAFEIVENSMEYNGQSDEIHAEIEELSLDELKKFIEENNEKTEDNPEP